MLKEKVNAIVAAYCKAYGAEEDNIDFLESQFDAFRDYFNAVVTMEYRIPIMRFRMEGDELREAIMELDRHRKVCHDAAIASCTVLNRISAKLGLEPFFTGDPEDRYQVADFVEAFATELYHNGITVAREDRQVIPPTRVCTIHAGKEDE